VRRLFLCLLFLPSIALIGPSDAVGGTRPAGTGPPGVRSDFNGDGYSDLAAGVPHEVFDGHDNAGVVNIIYGSVDGLDGAGNELWHQDIVSDAVAIQNQVEPGDRFGATLAAADFDSDGYSDLVVGAPGESNGATDAVGAVHFIYGSPTGLTGEGNEFLWQGGTLDGIAIKGTPQAEDQFGDALAVGNFGKGGLPDLAVGVPNDVAGGKSEAGVVHVFYGDRQGFAGEGNQLWSQNSKSKGVAVKDSAENFDNFGFGLAAGDFGKDTRDDLAIGVPDESGGGTSNHGAVNVLYGARKGLTTKGNQLWHQDSKGGGVKIKEQREGDDHLGTSLAAGNFGKSGQDDLAIGVFDESVGGADEAGAVNVIYGSDKGLRTPGNQLWHQDSAQGASEILDEAEENDSFSNDLVAANFGNGGKEDLVVGVQNESYSGLDFPGLIHIIYGSDTGLTYADNFTFIQSQGSVEDDSEDNDFFGGELGWAYFNNDGLADLAVSGYGEEINGQTAAGAVNILFGYPDGLDDDIDEFWHQDSTLGGAIVGGAEANDIFGAGLAGND
jgi:FG-GAP repeat